ncbi:hypothetical protein O181_062218 [Austropuccinia psidii MF-1]|uniref:Uncharacterized protein n=1 Tax=Austropuccinia psidii MF-1 TaxID=1389203 RepID=A0A9Q3HZB2_9BASI|nr:hypothetical protein [Austropuccinia psidii MF-1]
MESTIIQTSKQKYKGLAQKKERGKQGRSPSSFYQKATSHTASQEGKKNKKKNWRKPYSTIYRILTIQKAAMENFFNRERALMELKDKEEQRMRQPHFPKKYPFALML